MLGADGVVMGSRFWASSEALVQAGLHEAGLRAGGDDTIRTSVMDMARRLDWPARFTLRLRRNDFTARWHGKEADLAADIDREAERYRQAWAAGDPATAAVMIGEAAGLIHEIEPAADIVSRTVNDAIALLGTRGPQFVVGTPA
jgi:nitronate monooxygenase